ncbi:MAG TPA: DNA repair protein RecO [Saprospiraceae bacterium]|nr:DNA repair protein RecO [Saprospiraceae bacterium]
MIDNTRGIVLKTIKYRDTSAIVDVFTEKFGLKTYIVNSVFKAKPRVAPSLLQLGSALQMVVYNKEGRKINRIREVRADFYPGATITDLRRSAIKLFMVELSRKTLQFDEPQSGLFSELRDSVYQVENSEQPVVNCHLYFLVRLLIHFGLFPDLSGWPEKKILSVQEGTLFEETPEKGLLIPSQMVRILVELEASDRLGLHEVKLSREERQSFIEHMLSYYNFHIENFSQMNTHLIYKQLM